MDMWFDGKSAMSHYGLALRSCTITPPERKQYLIDIPGADGSMDLTVGMGPPRYAMRTVTAKFAPLLADVRQTLDLLINDLEGQTVPIVLPGDLDHYMTGIVHVQSSGGYPNVEIVVVATCMPWRYAVQVTRRQVPASVEPVLCTWYNAGTRGVVPEITVAGQDATITLSNVRMLLPPGTYLPPELAIPGKSAITVAVQGGTVTAKYREAIL